MKYSVPFLFFSILLLFNGCDSITEPDIKVPEGFELEVLYEPSTHDQGSWVAITEGGNGTMYTCDQYGAIYYFPIPPDGEEINPNDVDTVAVNVGHAHGLLWAFNSLYAVVVKKEDPEKPDQLSSGVYRITDSDGDGSLDASSKILHVDGYSEHGPHTLLVGPEGDRIYLIAGNFNSVPEEMTSRLPRNWGEDNLFPPYLDARGHAVDLKAPGGWIASADPNGEKWELMAAGFRNPFGMGFNEEGELFAYDADMEWDFGMPWYRPTRILHVTSAAEFGWRTGSGKWPVYLPDNLSAVQNMAQGSPTAVIMGRHLNFPSKYKNGLFACDWSFGTIYYVDLIPDGSSYKGTREEFLSGTPLPISNATAGSDGHFYFTTGGRRIDSRLYRLRYTGEEAETPVAVADGSAAKRELRKSIEQYHTAPSSEGLFVAGANLNNDDERIAYASRLVLENMPIDQWKHLIWNEKDTEKVLNSALAYARSDGDLSEEILDKLIQLNWADLSDIQRINLTRVYELLLIRNEKYSSEFNDRIVQHIDAHYPSGDARLNRQLCQLLLYLKATNAVDRTMEVLRLATTNSQELQSEILSNESLERSAQYGPQIQEMIKAMPPTEAIHYVTMLSHVKDGWTDDLRKEYFEWFFEALSGKGGESYKSFIDNIRAKALDNVSEDVKEKYSEIAGFYSPIKSMADLPQPVGPGKDYNLMDLGSMVMWENALEDYKGSLADGERAYKAALCYSCHRMNGNGADSGPDLSQINTRFSKGDLVNSILSPSEEISDQYSFTLFTKKDGSKVTGRIVNETDEVLEIYQSPFDMTITTTLNKADIADQMKSPLSPMPAKLLDRLNEQEVKDLMVYLLSGGKEDGEWYN
jgi:putative heme-binding domain-containing protein